MAEGITVLSSEPLPKGYRFLPKGSIYRTVLGQRLTREAGRPLFIVLHPKTKARIGIRIPSNILREVQRQDTLTKAARLAATHRRDENLERQARDVLRKLYPKIPSSAMEQCLHRAFKKRAGRIGRCFTVDMTKRVHLALAAHVRHTLTDYDKLLNAGSTKEKARKAINPKVGKILAGWR
ncbi:hypothetical protein BU16DRAFT_467277 [Lophium mytilinum]|uniref:DUF2293 domain-containing protein n=1 Tax=Lophium mytilinum TaxID=390894 RepID=A0A6A6QKW9_9PEZI|nr:hypothetical protein BU16DRAFT_467277 [Lophium mytilinum]